jgi:uncharacterized membrane protein YfcA
VEFPEVALVLFSLALLAGFVDAIAGGGGLITIPALLWAGLSPVESLATNKAQAVFGSGSATIHYLRKGLIEPRGAALRSPVSSSARHSGRCWSNSWIATPFSDSSRRS